MDLKMKKAARVVIAGACAGALALGAALPAFAAGTDPKSGQTKVSYDTSTTIETGLSWVVRIPSSLSFSTDKKSADVTLTVLSKTSTPLKSLTDFPGYVAPTVPGGTPTWGTLDVHVASKNNLQLQLSDGTDPLKYTLTSPGGTSWVTGGGLLLRPDDPHAVQRPVFCSFKQSEAGDSTSMSKTGHATVTGTPTKDGDHTDELTFGFNSKKTPPTS